ncbi:unnamed protein product, partial [Mesorhabditis belari]|uniref:Uncharacterized protein n=1 Tax=Mesorhabditis belari TaxID=2138241 RepID=A0AAF3ELU6_9BILA
MAGYGASESTIEAATTTTSTTTTTTSTTAAPLNRKRRDADKVEATLDPSNPICLMCPSCIECSGNVLNRKRRDVEGASDLTTEVPICAAQSDCPDGQVKMHI